VYRSSGHPRIDHLAIRASIICYRRIDHLPIGASIIGISGYRRPPSPGPNTPMFR